MPKQQNFGKTNGLGVTHQSSFAKPTTHKNIKGGASHHKKMKRGSAKGQIR